MYVWYGAVPNTDEDHHCISDVVEYSPHLNSNTGVPTPTVKLRIVVSIGRSAAASGFAGERRLTAVSGSNLPDLFLSAPTARTCHKHVTACFFVTK